MLITEAGEIRIGLTIEYNAMRVFAFFAFDEQRKRRADRFCYILFVIRFSECLQFYRWFALLNDLGGVILESRSC